MVFILVRPLSVVAFQPADVYIEGLVASWSDRPDGVAGPKNLDNSGFALSVAFVNHPSLFLKILSSHPDVFAEWLGSIRRHTCNRTDPAEPGRGRRVFRLVHETALVWSGVKYREMTAAIVRATEERP